MDCRSDGLEDMIRVSNRLGLFIGVACLAFAAIGCGGSGSSGTGVPDPSVAFVNGLSDSTAVDFSLNETNKATSVAFPTVSGAFISTSADTYDVGFREHGQTGDLDTTVQALAKNHDYVVIAAGLENYGSEPNKRARVDVLDIDRTAPNGNKAKLIVVHDFSRATGYETPSVDFKNPGDTPQYTTGAIAFAASSTLTVDSGSQTFEVRRDGTEEIYVAGKTVTLTAGKVYVVLISGVEAGTGNQTPDFKLIEIQSRTN